MKRLVGQVERMSTTISELEEKGSRLKAEINKKKGSVSMEDTFEEDVELIEWVGSKIEHGHDKEKI